jgi:hypothetical protein
MQKCVQSVESLALGEKSTDSLPERNADIDQGENSRLGAAVQAKNCTGVVAIRSNIAQGEDLQFNIRQNGELRWRNIRMKPADPRDAKLSKSVNKRE